jgi:hypothetical protein
VACEADHKGLPAHFHHELRPRGLWSPWFDEVGELADMVHLHLGPFLARLAPARPKAGDQLFALAAAGYRGWLAVIEDRLLLPYQSDLGKRRPGVCGLSRGESP